MTVDLRMRDTLPPEDGLPSLFPGAGPAGTAALFHGIDGAPPPPRDPEVWRQELPRLRRQRLAGLALASARAARITLPREVDAELQDLQVRATARALTVESTAIAVVERLTRMGIPTVITKGPGIALVYPLPSLRPYGDLDVLVPPRRFNDAVEAVRALGFRDVFRGGEPRAYFDRYCREGVNLDREDGGSVDLHHRIPPWVWGDRLGFGDVVRRSREVVIAGGTVRTAGPVHNLLTAALHVISDRGLPGHKLLTWRDVASLALACDADDVVLEARRTRLDWYLSFILGQLPSYARPTTLLDRLGEVRPGRADAFRLRRLVPPAIGSRHQISQMFRLPVGNAAAFLGGYLVPSTAFLRHRFGSPWAYTQWWADAFVRLREAGYEWDPAASGDGDAEPTAVVRQGG